MSRSSRPSVGLCCGGKGCSVCDGRHRRLRDFYRVHRFFWFCKRCRLSRLHRVHRFYWFHRFHGVYWVHRFHSFFWFHRFHSVHRFFSVHRFHRFYYHELVNVNSLVPG